VEPGNTCSNAATIKPSYSYITNALTAGNLIHFYKVYVNKGNLLSVDLVNENSDTKNMSIMLYKDGSYDGTSWNCALILQSDCGPAPRRVKRLIFVPEIEGFYVIAVNNVAGAYGEYKLRVLSTPITTQAN
jgi:hypothetical protein